MSYPLRSFVGRMKLSLLDVRKTTTIFFMSGKICFYYLLQNERAVNCNKGEVYCKLTNLTGVGQYTTNETQIRWTNYSFILQLFGESLKR